MSMLQGTWVEHQTIVERFSCRCQNVTIDALEVTPADNSTNNFQSIRVGENGIHITHHYLTLRTRDGAHHSEGSGKKLTQHLLLWCLACKTRVYHISQEVSPGSEAREGPIMPTDDWVEQETLCSKNGCIEVYIGSEGCLVGNEAIRQHLGSMQFSEIFSIALVSPSSSDPGFVAPAITTPSLIDSLTESGKESSIQSMPTQILPALPPLFPPPPFSPSHPVFSSLAARASTRSTDLRRKAEEEIKLFVKSQMVMVEQEEAQLRKEVEAIWRGYREGWRDLMDRVNEERRHAMSKLQPSSSVTGVKSGIPMSIRDFSPILDFNPEGKDTPPNLSPPRIFSGQTQHPFANETNSLDDTETRSHANNGQGTILSVSPGTRGDIVSSAFKRNMDTSVDIASSVKWAQGEEEMRRRFGGGGSDRQDRARKRTSKSLGIAGDNPKHDVELPDSLKAGEDIIRSTECVPAENPVQSANTVDNQAELKSSNGVSKKSKRRVTFDVRNQANVAQRILAHHSGRDSTALVELFDLDGFTTSETSNHADMQSMLPARTRAIVRTPSYKLRRNGHVPFESATSLPATTTMLDGSVEERRSRLSGFVRPLTHPFPFLSASVPAQAQPQVATDLKGSELDLTPSHSDLPPPPSESMPSSSNDYSLDVDSHSYDLVTSSPLTEVPAGEQELKILLAASAPSHRHAWREGGKAWDIFRRRSKKPKRVSGVIAEEETEESSADIEGESDGSNDLNSHDMWRNPSRSASSLPVQIRPLLNYHPTLEPKTSLADKQGVLVPPLNTKSRNSSAIRKAVYAERDRIRAIDPGPTLDFNEETEDDDATSIVDETDRGRRHALSILQARSVVPEAGMWRSMAS